MGCDLLTKWLVHYDPVHFGLTAAGIAMGVHPTIGQPWHWPGGGTLLYRGQADAQGDATIDYADPVGAAAKPASSIQNFGWRGHDADSEYDYSVRHVGSGGVIEANARRPARIQTDGSGDVVVPVPEPPVLSSVEPLAGGKFALVFGFDLRAGAVEPQDFQVYHDNGTGTMDWVTPIGTVGYSGSGLVYRFVSGAYADTTVVKFGVRSRSSGGAVSKNVDTVSGVADAAGPADLDAPTARCGT